MRLHCALFISAASLGLSGCLLLNPDEECNGRDDDEDGEVDEGFPVGSSCDGEDSDLCQDGAFECDPGGEDVMCLDEGEDHVETCNQLDEDCDDNIDEDFDLVTDIENCGGCELACTNRFGTTGCGDSMCDFTCEEGAEDCNTDPYDGCEVKLDADPLCDYKTDLGSIPGDIFGDFTYTGVGEEWLLVFVDEVSEANRGPTATFDLESPEGMNFDLHLYCGTCGDDTPIRSSTLPAGETDTVDYGRPDTAYVNDGAAVFLEVRHAEGTDTCAEWTLRVSGGTTVGETTCS